MTKVVVERLTGHGEYACRGCGHGVKGELARRLRFRGAREKVVVLCPDCWRDLLAAVEADTRRALTTAD